MTRIALIFSVPLILASNAFAQSDDQLIETVRSSAVDVFLKQASWVMPDSFYESDLAQSEKEQIVLQLARDTGDCLADSAVEYAVKNDIPIPSFVSDDGTIHFDGDSGREYMQLLELCINKAWLEAGISRE